MDVLLVVIKVCILLAAAVLLGFSIISVLGTRKFMARAVSAEGTILDITRATSFSGNGNGIAAIRYHFYIAFKTESGKELRFQSAAVPHGNYQPGDNVDVLYDPAGVGEPRLSSFRGIWGRSIEIAMYSLNCVAFWLFVTMASYFLPLFGR